MKLLAGTNSLCLSGLTICGIAFAFAPTSADAAPVADDVELVSGEYFRADPVPVPAEYLGDAPTEPQAAASGTLFINFDGANLSPGNDNAPNNTTQMPSQYAQQNYPAYGDGPKRAATFQSVVTDWSPFNVLITDVRPNSGPYHMCMTGPGKGNGLPNGVLGIAPLDCNDGQKNNIVYAFHSANDQFPASTQATTISQELAHAFGLEHVTQPSDIMNPFNAGGDPAFLDECFNIDGGGNGILCGSQHSQFCSQTTQNSYQELLGFFGPSSPDLEAPTVSITFPANGAVYQEGDSFTIEVSASDDVGVSQVVLMEGGNMIGNPDMGEPYAWPVQNIGAGTYAFSAVAHDNASNQTTSAVVMVTVNPAGGTTGGSTSTGGTSTGTSGSGSGTGGDTDSGGDSSGDSASGDDDDTGSDDATASSALPPGYGDGIGEDGCSIPGRSAGNLGFLLLPLLLGLRRRRS